MTPLVLDNRQARALWLEHNLLLGPPTGRLDLPGLVDRLGFVQIDTIRNVVRAQDHIIWSRNLNFREGGLWPLLAGRVLFEHFTHDASLLPRRLLPLWQGQFRRLGEKAARDAWFRSGLAGHEIAAIRARIRREGPLSTRAFDSKIRGGGEMWSRPPHKKALEQMWYGGELATAYRRNLVKFYDLGERVLGRVEPAPEAGARLCALALDRLGMARPGEIARFWDAVALAEVKRWIAANRRLVALRWQDAGGAWHRAVAPADIEHRLAALPAPGSRMRLINPFDPAVRDRARLRRLFGFDYRNEMFVPRQRRRWGYYVYPLLEGLRFVGRVELQAERRAGRLRVVGFWPEPGVRWSAPRQARLAAELGRFARFAGLAAPPWPPDGAGFSVKDRAG